MAEDACAPEPQLDPWQPKVHPPKSAEEMAANRAIRHALRERERKRMYECPVLYRRHPKDISSGEENPDYPRKTPEDIRQHHREGDELWQQGLYHRCVEYYKGAEQRRAAGAGGRSGLTMRAAVGRLTTAVFGRLTAARSR